jgi:hypothetical protein
MVGSRKVEEDQHVRYFCVNTLDVCFFAVYIVICFTVPGQIVDLALVPSPHNVSLEWKKPSYNGDCVTHYEISWRHTENGNTSSSNTGKEEYSYVIGSLDACVVYEISVSAENGKNESNVREVSVRTETEGK